MSSDTDSDDSTDTRQGKTPAHTDGGIEVGLDHHGTARPSGAITTTDDVLLRVADVLAGVSYRWVQASFAFVFFYFGLQKWPVVQGASPVRPPVKAFVEAVGFGGWIPLPAEVGLLAIGVYEVTLGTLWMATILEETRLGTSRLFLAAGAMTVAHQVVTLLPLLLVPDVAFRQTELWIPTVGTVPFGAALDWLSAFILKNLLFFGAFFYVFVEWTERYGPGGAVQD